MDLDFLFPAVGNGKTSCELKNEICSKLYQCAVCCRVTWILCDWAQTISSGEYTGLYLSCAILQQYGGFPQFLAAACDGVT